MALYIPPIGEIIDIPIPKNSELLEELIDKYFGQDEVTTCITENGDLVFYTPKVDPERVVVNTRATTYAEHYIFGPALLVFSTESEMDIDDPNCLENLL